MSGGGIRRITGKRRVESATLSEGKGGSKLGWGRVGSSE